MRSKDKVSEGEKLKENEVASQPKSFPGSTRKFRSGSAKSNKASLKTSEKSPSKVSSRRYGQKHKQTKS